MNRLTRFAVLGLALLLATVTTALAAAPNLLQYQGRLTDNTGAPLNGSFNTTFTIYSDSAGTTSLWTEVRPVTYANGLFSLTLGTAVAIPASVSNGTDRFLGIKVAPDAADMLPRQRLAAVAFARRAAEADHATTADVLTVGPVLAHRVAGDKAIPLNTTVCADSVEITIPGPGFILLQNAGVVYNNTHANGTYSYLAWRVDEARFVTTAGTGYQWFALPAELPSGNPYSGTISASRTYQKGAAGTYRFYFNAYGFGGLYYIQHLEMTAMYFPSGTLTSPQGKESSAGAEYPVAPQRP
jgi:hypothetical protein